MPRIVVGTWTAPADKEAKIQSSRSLYSSITAQFFQVWLETSELTMDGWTDKLMNNESELLSVVPGLLYISLSPSQKEGLVLSSLYLLETAGDSIQTRGVWCPMQKHLAVKLETEVSSLLPSQTQKDLAMHFMLLDSKSRSQEWSAGW